jgi:hypothetical protein
MTNNPNDAVRVAAGSLVALEAYQAGLSEVGIVSKLLGDALESSFGSAIPGSLELWVHRSDAERATEVIREIEARRGEPVPGIGGEAEE